MNTDGGSSPPPGPAKGWSSPAIRRKGKRLSLKLIPLLVVSPMLAVWYQTAALSSLQHQNQDLEVNPTTSLPTESVVVDVAERPPKIYYCDNRRGNEVDSMLNTLGSVFPNHTEQNLLRGANSEGLHDEMRLMLRHLYGASHPPQAGGNPYDVFILRAGQICADRVVVAWLQFYFPGKIIMWSPESSYPPNHYNDNTYHLGPERDDEGGASPHLHSMRLYHLQIIFWSLFHLNTPDNRFHFNNRSDAFLFDPTNRPRNSGKHFLVYGNSNCQPHRDKAFDALGTIAPAHAAGKCPKELGQSTRIDAHVSLRNWGDNAMLYKDYRFCLVMEHSQHEGYITEKILMAFYAGCVPIYYGPLSIFDMFNPEAFIFYDVNNPNEALDKISQLERNLTAYAYVMGQPILRNGRYTIEKYFSFSDDVGEGKLKTRITEWLGLDLFQFVVGEGKRAVSKIVIANNTEHNFCDHCSWRGKITCGKRVDYLMEKYGSPLKDSMESILAENASNCAANK